MNNLLVALVCLLVVNTACATGAFTSVLGIFMGMADWYEFDVDTSKPLGGAVANYQQNTRLVFTEQQGVCDCARTCFAYSLNTSELILSLLVQTSLSFFSLSPPGPFFRGTEYYEDSSQPTGWAFVANLYGIMTASPNKAGVYTLRINEFLNEDSAAQDASDVTVGVFTGQLSNCTAEPEMSLQYTGGTKVRNKFGAQHLVAKLQQ